MGTKSTQIGWYNYKRWFYAATNPASPIRNITAQSDVWIENNIFFMALSGFKSCDLGAQITPFLSTFGPNRDRSDPCNSKKTRFVQKLEKHTTATHQGTWNEALFIETTKNQRDIYSFMLIEKIYCKS